MKAVVVPEEQSRKCPCQVCVIVAVSADRSWDEHLCFNKVEFDVALFPNTAPSPFHNVRFPSLGNECDTEDFPSTSGVFKLC